MAYVDLGNFKNAITVFEEFRVDMITNRDKAGAVQAYKVCYELAWKMMQRVLKSEGEETGSPKDVFRKAQKRAIIEDAELWFNFQDLRNLTSHTYNAKSLEVIVASFDSFSLELARLNKSLERIV